MSLCECSVYGCSACMLPCRNFQCGKVFLSVKKQGRIQEFLEGGPAKLICRSSQMVGVLLTVTCHCDTWM